MINNEEIYRQLYTIRKFEETLLNLFDKGLLNGTVHTCIGQETISVSIMNKIDKDKDIIFSNHRAHGHFIAYCDKVEELLWEIMGKKDGVCKGIGGSQHLHFKNFYTNGIQGGIVPIAVGAALAEKLKRTKSIVIVFLGDGTMGQGVVYESFNIAAKLSLPILFVLEDNKYAQSTKKDLVHAGSLSERAHPFGIKTISTNDNIESLFPIIEEIVNYVRLNVRPAFVHIDTYRFAPHSKGDDFRDVDELQFYKSKDQIINFRSKLKNEIASKIESEVESRINKAVEDGLQKRSLKLDELLSLGE
jgi:TPP-dependent pyruvate/acetoin dehydrogenase alpha subunit